MKSEMLPPNYTTLSDLVSVIPASVDTDVQEGSEAETPQPVTRQEMLEADESAEAIHFFLTRSSASDIVNLR
jgi:hypothetical protein